MSFDQTKIDVIWHSQEDGRGRYNCTTMLNDVFDRYNCVHHAGRKYMPKGIEGGVVIVHGGRQMGEIDRVNMDLDELKWALVIFLGDEECSFPIEKVEVPENRITWIQEPMVPGKHATIPHRPILDGYTPHCRNFAVPQTPKDLDWFFAGQVTHERRRECVAALQSIDWGGVIIETKGYCQGIPEQAYFQMMNRARLVPCPSGPLSPDAARPWEALECGAIPILDDLSPVRKKGGFWAHVLGDHPMPWVTRWESLPDLIDTLKKTGNLDMIQKECLTWWADYKFKFAKALGDDLKKLRG